ncbi:hypothetical protein O7628_22590 [Micromonospora sp. WMMD956]|uniref:hypothetical protein n=1 Tax=Micromonospora sp. WMMD956 TaxID=3016108 RepID=UPI0024162B04|nr:hypothetical protein [Micromonospora sp. WMMD956]MDG4818275.1 hypothetical protein [Micromonospora sp. WMMD956]
MTVESWGTTYWGGPGATGGTWWPVGKHVVEHGRLKQVLALSARHHARQAIELFATDDQDGLTQAAVSAGCAVELLAKAFLASVEPGLLAEKGDRDTILILSGNANLASARIAEMKTVGALEALKIAKHLHPSLSFNLQSDQVVLRVRNSAAHMGMVLPDELRAAVAVMCRLVEGLLAALLLERDKYWGDHAIGVVDEILDVAKSEVRRIVAAKIAVAERRFAGLVSGLDAAGRAVVLSALSRRDPYTTADHNEPYQCPACKQQGWLVCHVDEGQPEIGYDDDGTQYSFAPRTAYPFFFECPVCELELEEEELAELDYPMEIELDPNSDPYSNYEPDEDWVRGR